jgi:hypothetical protein
VAQTRGIATIQPGDRIKRARKAIVAGGDEKETAKTHSDTGKFISVHQSLATLRLFGIYSMAQQKAS